MNILITSAGRRSYLVKYFKDVFSGEGKVFASNSEYTIALQEADGYLLTPMIYDDQYVDKLIDYCKNNKINAIISVFDIDLLVLSKAKDKFNNAGVILLVSDVEAIEICNDKWKTKKWLDSLGVKTPRTYKTLSDAKDAIKNGELKYPVVIKPRWGMASLGIFYADNEQELEIFAIKSKREVENTYLKYESSTTPGEEVLFQQKLVGVEYGIDVINDLDANYVCTLPKSKLIMRAGETDMGQTTDPSIFEGVAKKISENLKHIVILSVDCFDVDGDIYVTEMNCRISGHYPLSHVAGVDLPRQIKDWLMGHSTDMSNFKFEQGLYIIKDLEPVLLNTPKQVKDK